MYGEPDWSSLTLPELLEKASELSGKAYSSNLGAFASLMRAMERTRPGSTLGAEIVELAEQAQKINNDILALKNGITKSMSSRECTK